MEPIAKFSAWKNTSGCPVDPCSFKKNKKSSRKRTWNIQSGMPFHSMPASQGIFYSCCQGVAQMQASSDVGGWDDHDKFFFWFLSFCCLGLARVKTRCFPPILPSGLDGFRVISGCHGNFREIFLFSLGCLIDKFWSRGDFLFSLFIFLSFSPLWLFLFLSLWPESRLD